jgi:hypothetical protein
MFSLQYLPFLLATASAAAIGGALVPRQDAPAQAEAISLLIENFGNTDTNSLGFYHGISGGGLFGEFDRGDGTRLKVSTGNIDGM